MHILAPVQAAGKFLLIDSEVTTGYNIYTAAVAKYGSITTAIDLVITVASGIIVHTAGSGYAMQTGTGWIAGTTLTLVNNGYIEGWGAAGNTLWSTYAGHAIYLQWPMSINNTSGYIRGGGGGGALGVASGPLAFFDGGGGGGGQGNPGGTGGARTGSTGTNPVPADGTAGSRTGAGGGGVGGSAIRATQYGGTGGNGGGWGQNGVMCGYNSENVGHYVGSYAGYAIKTNGNAVTWLGGNNSTQVKGQVAT